MSMTVIAWILFHVLIFGLLSIDLFVFHKKEHEIKTKEAILWSVFWILIALTFDLFIYIEKGPAAAIEFLTAYVVEESLSVDNLFVFLMIFSYFNVPPAYRHKILTWGIIGALIFRIVFILTGVAVIHRFHWILYILGAFLIVIGIKMAFQKDKEIHPENNFFIKLLKRFLPVTDKFHEGNFFVKINSVRYATPLFVTLLAVETTDIVFAIDSIPAVLAISNDPFIVYTSNVFAILGLRALYFAIAGSLQYFCYLNYGLAFILSFIGIKILIADWYPIPIFYALLTVGLILFISILASLLFPKVDKEPAVQKK